MTTLERARLPHQGGFTLIELMIAVVILAILGAVAIPSYQSHLAKGRRGAAQAFMMDVASKEKQYLLDARAYLAVTDTTGLNTLGASIPSEVSSYYTVTVSTASAPPTFTVTATPISGGAQASDGTLTLTSDGTKSPSGKW